MIKLISVDGMLGPANYWLLNDSAPELLSKICNGCGSKGVGGYIIPDTICGVSITAACSIHDFMYASGLTIKDKYIADCTLLENTKMCIQKQAKWYQKPIAYGLAYVYYYSVKKKGLEYFAAASLPEDVVDFLSIDNFDSKLH